MGTYHLDKKNPGIPVESQMEQIFRKITRNYSNPFCSAWNGSRPELRKLLTFASSYFLVISLGWFADFVKPFLLFSGYPNRFVITNREHPRSRDISKFSQNYYREFPPHRKF